MLNKLVSAQHMYLNRSRVTDCRFSRERGPAAVPLAMRCGHDQSAVSRGRASPSAAHQTRAAAASRGGMRDAQGAHFPLSRIPTSELSNRTKKRHMRAVGTRTLTAESECEVRRTRPGLQSDSKMWGATAEPNGAGRAGGTGRRSFRWSGTLQALAVICASARERPRESCL
jgi:hypothetical protein